MMDLTDYAGKTAEIQIFDIAGKLVRARSELIVGEIVMDLSDLPNGVYAVLVEIDGGYFRARLVKE